MKCKKIEIKFQNYTEKSLSILPVEIDWLWKNINFENFQTRNFFLNEDLDYLKYLIRHILSSKLFKQIFEAFSNVSKVIDYYFSISENIEDYIRRIIFLPFGKNDLGKFAITDRHLLLVLVAGFPENNIHNINEYRIYRLIELSLRVIVLTGHEPGHFIKSGYALITNGMISRNTLNTDNSIERGFFFFEEVLFGWIHNEDNPLDLSELKLLEKDVKCKNTALNGKKIDLITSLKLLDPDIYNHDLKYFRNSLFNLTKSDLQSFSFSSSTNKEYKSYIESVLGCEEIKKIGDCNFSINASIGSYYNMCEEYSLFNHNIERFKHHKLI